MPFHRYNLYVLSLTMFLAALSWNQIVPFLPLFVEEMGVTGDTLYMWSGWIYTLPAVGSIIFQPLWGKAADRYGRKPMIIRAGVCLAAIYFGMSYCSSPLQLSILRFLNGALTGFIPGSVALIATNTPQNEAPRAVAVAQSFSNLGQILGPIVGGILAAFAGYRGSMRVSGMAVVFATILVVWLVKEPNKPKVAQSTSLSKDLSDSFKSPMLSSLMFVVMLYGAFVGAIYPNLPLHLREIGGEAEIWVLSWIYALPAVAFVATAYLWTRLGERIGFDRTILIGLIGAAVVVTTLMTAMNIWVFGFMYLLAGIFLASINPSMSALISLRIREDFRGRAYGMVFAATMSGVSLAPLAAGKVAGMFGIPAIFPIVGVVFAAGTVGFSIMTRRWGRDVLSSAVTLDERQEMAEA